MESERRIAFPLAGGCGPLAWSMAVFLCAALSAGEQPQALWTDAVPKTPGAREYFIAPDGTAANAGTAQAPWDIASGLDGSHAAAPGSIIWVKGGTYKHPNRKDGYYAAKLAGKKDAPILVRGVPGERATIDGGIAIENPAANLWLWDLEVLVSEPNRETKSPGSHPEDLGRPWGGVEIRGGTDCKAVSLTIHDCAQGMGVWSGAKGTEVHGCVIYGNGWQAPDRHHGHCIYTQNQDGVKTISGCILVARKDRTGGSYTMHAYGSARAYVDNYVIEDNIAFREGTFLIGGGRPSHNIIVRRNCLYGIPLRLGYGAENEDCEVRDNILAKSALEINKYKKVVDEGNVKALPPQKGVLIPNKYDPRRAHVAAFNGAKGPSVSVPVAPFLKPGEKFRLLNPEDCFGKPAAEGTCNGAEIAVPVAGEFSAYVLVKE